MITVKCTYSDGYTMITRINATFKEAKDYYLGNWFNIGSVADNMQKCVNIEQL